MTGISAELTTRTVAPATGQEESAGESGQVWYTVVRGDSLWAIAQRYGVTVESIVALNPDIRNPNLILVGQKVRVK